MTRRGLLSSFAIPSYRFQWSADVLSIWAYEMESLILGWWILVETESAVALAVVGALRYTGTLLAPVCGVLADRLPGRTLLLGMRVVFAVLAVALVLCETAGILAPVFVYIFAGVGGLIRPSEMVVRQSLIAATVPSELLSNAMGLTRTTMDSARIVGALAGAGLLASLGIGPAFVVVTLMYAICILLTFGIHRHAAVTPPARSQPVRELVTGMGYIASEHTIATVMVLAFIANLTAFPLVQGLMPAVAAEVYGYDAVGLARLLAVAAAGALVGSLFAAVALRTAHAVKMMFGGLIVWHILVFAFAFAETAPLAFILLALIGIVTSGAMIPMSVTLMIRSAPEFRGRVMGVRMLAVYGMPLGLLVGGTLIEWFSVQTAIATLGAGGLAAVVIVWSRWHALAPSNGGRTNHWSYARGGARAALAKRQPIPKSDTGVTPGFDGPSRPWGRQWAQRLKRVFNIESGID